MFVLACPSEKETSPVVILHEEMIVLFVREKDT